MKKIGVSFLMASMVLLTGCAAIKAELNKMELMKGYTFNSSADAVFDGAKRYYRNQNLTLNVTAKNIGVTPWKKKNVSFGSSTYTAKIRYVVTVSPAGKNKATIRIMEESVPYKSTIRGRGADMVTDSVIRSVPSEYMVLYFMDPAAAKRLDAKAEKM